MRAVVNVASFSSLHELSESRFFWAVCVRGIGLKVDMYVLNERMPDASSFLYCST